MEFRLALMSVQLEDGDLAEEAIPMTKLADNLRANDPWCQ